MFRKICAILLIAFIFCGTLSAVAEEFSAVGVYTPETGEVTISGSAQQGYIVIIIAPASLETDSFSDENVPTVIKQLSVSGGYEISLTMPDYAEGGKYYIYVSCGEDEIKDSFIHIKADGTEGTIEKLKDAEGDEFKKLAQDNAESLGIDKEDEVYIEKGDKILSLMDKLLYDDVYEFYEKYTLVYALMQLQGEDDMEKAEALFMAYDDILGIDFEKDYKNDEKLTADAKEELLKLLTGIDYSKKIKNGDIDFKELYESLKPVASIKTAKNWTQLRRAMTESFAEEFADMFQNSAKYKKVKDKDAVFEEMMKSDFASMEEVEEVFEKAVTKVYKSENKTVNGGTSGGASFGGGASAGGVSISPTYNEEKNETKAEIKLSDIDESHWAFDAVSKLCEDGIISGYEDGSFRPSSSITRAEFVKLILPFAASLKGGENISFGDVKDGAWYAPMVREAASKGIIKGDGDKFLPDNYIKREDAALIIYRLLSSLGKEPEGYRIFADREDVSPYAQKAVFALAGAYIIKGNDDNMFLPGSFITRAETAQLIYSAFKK